MANSGYRLSVDRELIFLDIFECYIVLTLNFLEFSLFQNLLHFYIRRDNFWFFLKGT